MRTEVLSFRSLRGPTCSMPCPADMVWPRRLCCNLCRMQGCHFCLWSIQDSFGTKRNRNPRCGGIPRPFFSLCQPLQSLPASTQLCHIGNCTRPVTIHGCCLLTKLYKPCPYTSLGKRAKTLTVFSHVYTHNTCAEKRIGGANLAIIVQNPKKHTKSYFYLLYLFLLIYLLIT